MPKKLIIVSLMAAALSIGLMGCTLEDSRKDDFIPTPPVQPLNSKQTVELRQIVNGVARVHSAVALAQGVSSDATVSDAVTTEIRNTVSKSDCSNVYKKSPATATEIDREKVIKVSGEKCLLEVNLDYSFINRETGAYSLLSALTIKDENLKTRNDVYDVALTGTGTSTVSNNGKDKQIEIRTSGSIVSLSQGPVQITSFYNLRKREVLGKMNSEGQRSVMLNFPQFKERPSFRAHLMANLSINSNKNESTYSLNGKEISELEFTNYIKLLGLDFE